MAFLKSEKEALQRSRDVQCQADNLLSSRLYSSPGVDEDEELDVCDQPLLQEDQARGRQDTGIERLATRMSREIMERLSSRVNSGLSKRGSGEGTKQMTVFCQI
jgi:hypothetical protein